MKKIIYPALLITVLSLPRLVVGAPFAVTIPNQQGGFTIGAAFLYLRPSSENLSYEPVVSGSTTSEEKFHAVNPTFSHGFDVITAYRFPNTGNGINLIWTHLGNTTDSDSFTDPTFHFVTVTSTSDVDVNHSSTAEFKYDAIDLNTDQRINFGDNFQMRCFGGVRGVDLQQQRNVTDHSNSVGRTSSNVPFTAISTDSLDQQLHFKGLGPQFGLDGHYCLYSGFGLEANVCTSMLVGDTDTDTIQKFLFTRQVGTAPSQTFNTIHTIDINKQWRIIPALDANLGLDYTYAFKNCYHSSLKVQAGYKVIQYFGIVQLLNSPMSAASIATHVGFDGPYIGFCVEL